MIDPDLSLAAVVAALNAIPSVVTATSSITGHRFSYGTDNSLARAIYEMVAGQVIVAQLDIIGGNFSAQNVWKHRFEVYLCPQNAVSDPTAVTPGHLWVMMMNTPVPAYTVPSINGSGTFTPNTGSGTLNFRQYRLLAGFEPVDPMGLNLIHHQTDTGDDRFCGHLVFTEYGDQ
jgi:hypothetical protein